MLQNDKAYFEKRCELCEKALRSVNGRALRRKEIKLEKKVYSEQQNQSDALLKKIKPLYNDAVKNFRAYSGNRVQVFESKGFEDGIDEIFDALDDSLMINIVIDASGDAMEFGAAYRIRKMSLSKIGISFDLTNERATQYLESDRPLVLSSMKETTKEHIKPILIEAQKSGKSYGEVAKIIKDNYAFSYDRAQMIATNEIGHAYEYGNRVPMDDLQAEGYKVTKKWSTAGDNLVTPECGDYEDLGWIPLDDDFISGSGTQDQEAPRDSNPNCRCTTLYEYE